MKLFKKLLPIATVAATAACTVPMVLTSCANSYISTTDIEYKAIEHPEVQLENKNAVIDEYFKNPKYLASDAVAFGASYAKILKQYLAEEFKEGFTFDARMTVNSVSVGEAKTIEISNEQTYGYVISTKMSIYLHLKGEQNNPESKNESIIEKIYGDVSATITYDLTNMFATLSRDENDWYVETYCLKDASDKWVYSKVQEITEVVEFTYKGGTKKTMDGKEIDSEYKSKQSESGEGEEALDYPASSFAKVTSKA